MLYSAKYKNRFQISALEDATFHSTFISHTQIGGKLEINLSKLLKKRTVHVLTSDHCTYVRPLKETTTHLSVFLNKDMPCSRENKALRKGHVTFRMLFIKKRLLSCLFCSKYQISCRDVGYYNNIKQSGRYSSDFVQKEYHCVVQMHGSEHTRPFR